jgi:pyruvate-formate lyase-activating enzyme
MPRSYLEPEIWDSQLRRTLLRQSPRESETYVYTIDVVGTCNLRCPTCPVGNSSGSQRPTGFMPLDLFERILDKIVVEAVTPHPAIWLFNWGEPLLHPELPSLIAAIKRRGLTCHLSSNLNITKGLQAVVKAGPDELKVSLSRFHPAEYQKTHVRGDLNLVKGNLYLLRHWLNHYASPTRVWVGHHIYKGGEAEIPAVAALCQELGFQHHPIAAFFQPLERVIDVLDGKYVADPILQALPEHPKDYVPRLAADRSPHHDCELRFNQTIINFDGSLALCCNVYDAANMLKLNFLDTPHQAIQEARYQHPFCKTCFARGLQYGVRDVRTARAP